MNFDHIHFYVEDAKAWRDWFVQIFGFQWIASHNRLDTEQQVISNGFLKFLLSAPLNGKSPVAHYLRQHPPGVVDVAFSVKDIETYLSRAGGCGAKILQPLQLNYQTGSLVKQAQIEGWGNVKHTLVERVGFRSAVGHDHHGLVDRTSSSLVSASLVGIDHVVLNVNQGELAAAVAFYEKVLGWQRQQAFSIRTQQSALHSQVLVHANGAVQFPINEPASANSQIQEFLNLNGGAGIQHIALKTREITQTIAHLRQQGLSFLPVPPVYYEQVQDRSGFCLDQSDWEAIVAQEVLVDWQPETPEAILLQTFTQPIFSQPTFFFELIERRTYWHNQQAHQARGFGEGNFKALFEAIEREQVKRGSLTTSSRRNLE